MDKHHMNQQRGKPMTLIATENVQKDENHTNICTRL